MKKTSYRLDYGYFDSPLALGDFRLYQAGRRFCTKDDPIIPHLHQDWFELTVVNGGKGICQANEYQTELTAGDIFLSLPGETHGISVEGDDPFDFYFIAFSTQTETDGGTSAENKSLHEDLESILLSVPNFHKRVFKSESVISLIQSAVDEISSPTVGYHESVLRSILQLIAIKTVSNFNGREITEPELSDNQLLCYRIMSYVDTHVYSIRSLAEIADKLNYNYRYLSGLFHRITGKTIVEYTASRKMEIGRALIIEGVQSIGEIAESLGYSPYSFSRAFKKYYGAAPTSFSQKQP